MFKRASQQTWDVHTDFPYDGQSENDCLNTVASRILFKLFNKNEIDVSLSFQGGDNFISFPWGSKSRSNDENDEMEAYLAPDYASFNWIS